jgi:hypothetical protein
VIVPGQHQTHAVALEDRRKLLAHLQIGSVASRCTVLGGKTRRAWAESGRQILFEPGELGRLTSWVIAKRRIRVQRHEVLRPILEAIVALGVVRVVRARAVLGQHDTDVPLCEFTGSGPGITYVVTGGGGAALYPSGSDYWTAVSSSVYHYTRVSVDGCTLRVEAVRIDGVVFDQFAIDRCTPAP